MTTNNVWGTNPSGATEQEKVIEFVNGTFCSLIDTIKQFSATDGLAIERLLTVRTTLADLETSIVKHSISTDTAVR